MTQVLNRKIPARLSTFIDDVVFLCMFHEC